MPLIQRDPAILDDAGHDAGFRQARANRANAAVPFGDVVNLRTHFGGGEKSILAPVHRRAARMRGLPVKINRMALHAKGAKHSPEREIEIEKHRSLFDMQFQIRGSVREFFAAVLYLFEIDPLLFQRCRKGDALFVFQVSRLVHVEISRARRRTEKALPKSRPFFIRPVHQANGHRRLAVKLSVNATKNLNACERVQAAIEPAPVRHRIDMSADE